MSDRTVEISRDMAWEYRHLLTRRLVELEEERPSLQYFLDNAEPKDRKCWEQLLGGNANMVSEARRRLKVLDHALSAEREAC